MTNGEKIQQDFECKVCEPIIEDNIIHVIFADKLHSAIGFDWDWWNAEYKEPTTKNNLDTINGLDDFIEFGKKAFGVELTIKKSDNPDTYAKLFGTTKNDLGVDCIARQDVERFIEGFINEYTPKEELEFINLELDGLKHIPSTTPQQYQEEHKTLERIKEIMSHEWSCWTPDYIQRVLDGTEDRY